MDYKQLVVGRLYISGDISGEYCISCDPTNRPMIASLNGDKQIFLYMGQGKGPFKGLCWFLDTNSRSVYFMPGISKISGTARFFERIKEL